MCFGSCSRANPCFGRSGNASSAVLAAYTRCSGWLLDGGDCFSAVAKGLKIGKANADDLALRQATRLPSSQRLSARLKRETSETRPYQLYLHEIDISRWRQTARSQALDSRNQDAAPCSGGAESPGSSAPHLPDWTYAIPVSRARRIGCPLDSCARGCCPVNILVNVACSNAAHEQRYDGSC